MNTWMLVASALALAIERVAYGVIWHRPVLFTRFCGGVPPSRDPVDALAALFAGFKGIQAVMFLAWCIFHGGIARRDSGDVPWLVSIVVVVAVIVPALLGECLSEGHPVVLRPQDAPAA